MRAIAALLALVLVPPVAVGALRPDLVPDRVLDVVPLPAAPTLVSGLIGPKPDPPKRPTTRDPAKPLALSLGPVPAPVAVAPREDPAVQRLAGPLQQAVVRSGFAGRFGVHVLDGDGRILFDLGATEPLVPASTAKLITAAAVLTAFGPDHRMTTVVGATAAPDAAGVVDGDLVLVGGADPTLTSNVFTTARIDPDRPRTPIGEIADAVVAAGVTRITGGVLGDGGHLAGPPLAEGWPARYLEELDAVPITGLTIDRGLRFVQQGGRLRAVAAPDPVAEAAAGLLTALDQRGVVVEGGAAGQAGAAGRVVAELGEVHSPPVSVMLRSVVQDSDNHMADTLFRAAGRHAEGDGSFAAAEALLPRLLAELQLDWSAVRMADGSGLSRASRIPPALLTVLNHRMTRSPAGAAWQELMAVSGVSGTLERRLTGSIAELRLRGKTGSLQDVRALTGAVVGPDGQPVYTTITATDLPRADLDNARRLQDLVVLALVADLYGCTEVPVPAPSAAAPDTATPSDPASPDATPPPPAATPAADPDALPPLPAHTC